MQLGLDFFYPPAKYAQGCPQVCLVGLNQEPQIHKEMYFYITFENGCFLFY